MPSEYIADKKRDGYPVSDHTGFAPFIVCMFLLMLTFFIYPSNFAIETMKAGIFSQSAIGPIMAMMDLLGFAGGLLFSKIKGIAVTCGWLIVLRNRRQRHRRDETEQSCFCSKCMLII